MEASRRHQFKTDKILTGPDSQRSCFATWEFGFEARQGPWRLSKHAACLDFRNKERSSTCMWHHNVHTKYA